MTLQVYSWPTPNGHKVHIMLEELGLAYEVVPVDIGAGAQFEPDFLRISPNNRIPALVDPEGPGGQPLSLFESGAILIYLAEKTGRFLPPEGGPRYAVLQWLMWQMGGLGPMLGQAHHFLQYAPEDVPYGKTRYSGEARRLYGVLDRRLAQSRYLGGDDYSIADMAAWPWTRVPHKQGVERDDYPNFRRWFAEIEARAAVQRGIKVLSGIRRPVLDDRQKEILFGAGQHRPR